MSLTNKVGLNLNFIHNLFDIFAGIWTRGLAWIWRRPPKPQVVGSNPTGSAQI